MDWAKVKNMSKEEQVRIQAAAWKEAGARMEEERLPTLATRSDEEHRRDLQALAELGARMLPKSPGEWEAFDAVEHELVAFQRLVKPIHERLRGRAED